ncbi:MAG TPA: PHB depolymerase family esterase [Solirubrobacteraceae bacterium]|jgi:poly(hydroxyalkanoate) depolymerase family esterase|nr:PHB depolymerase family esterase [Solirubrobacteraceae bacterium]
MPLVDWRELYASNRAVIERAGGVPSDLPSAFRAPGQAILPGRPVRGRVSHEAGAWEEHTITTAGRTRRAFVHAPGGVGSQTALPLVCMLHGCTQDAASFAAATKMNEVADRHGFVAVYPQQERGENQQRCWNWFLPEHQARGAGEPASIAAIVRQVAGTTSPWTIDTSRVFVAGVSAGGAMAAILAATYPDLFAAAAVHSGLAYGSATSLGDALAAMARGGGDGARLGSAAHAAMGHHARPVPSITVHGQDDRTVAPHNARLVLEQSMTANRLAAPETCDFDIAHPSVTQRGEVDGGHAYARSQWMDRRGALMHELLTIDGLGHAWSGGASHGSITDARGPDASEAIWRFFEASLHEPTG